MNPLHGGLPQPLEGFLDPRIRWAYGSLAANTPDQLLTDTVTQQPVAAIPNKRIMLVSLIMLNTGGTLTLVTIKSSGSGDNIPISPPLPVGINGGGFIWPPNLLGWALTKFNEAMTFNTGAGTTLSALAQYVVTDI